jgi:hypothetical protein
MQLVCFNLVRSQCYYNDEEVVKKNVDLHHVLRHGSRAACCKYPFLKTIDGKSVGESRRRGKGEEMSEGEDELMDAPGRSHAAYGKLLR